MVAIAALAPRAAEGVAGAAHALGAAALRGRPAHRIVGLLPTLSRGGRRLHLRRRPAGPALAPASAVLIPTAAHPVLAAAHVGQAHGVGGLAPALCTVRVDRLHWPSHHYARHGCYHRHQRRNSQRRRHYR